MADDKKSFGLNRTIVGLPLGFTQATDPNFRVFTKTFVQNANIVNIVPGKPTFTKGSLSEEKQEALISLITETPDEGGGDFDGLWQKGEFGADGDKIPVPEMNVSYYEDNEKITGLSEEHRERDLRFYSFDVDFAEYRRILNVLLNEVAAKVAGFAVSHNIDKYLDIGKWHDEGIHFYCEAATTVSESGSNDVSESSLEQATSEVVSKAREFAFTTGMAQARGGWTGRATTMASAAARQVQKVQELGGVLSAAKGDVGQALTQLNASMADQARKGEKIMYPKVWKNSTFDKSYNLVFKFMTPYGDPQSVFEFVYLPFLMLMAFAFPRQVSPSSFEAPMLVRLDSPGFMNCDMGMFNSFSFVRGGSDNQWTANGLPRCIEVTCSVTDMYPAMAVATNQALLRQNIGLSSFLDNMCGLNVMEAHIVESLRASIMAKLSLFTGAPDTVVVSAKDAIEHLADRIF